jgi:UDP:flavonoid glycosyltransferase YjiC (YdhE family)
MSPLHKTIVLAPASGFLFHVGRCLGLARELTARGHRVILVGIPRFLQDPALVNRDTFGYFELPDFDTEQALDLLRSVAHGPPRRLVKEMVELELQLLRRLKPDLVIVDFRLSMYLSARAMGIPVVALLMGLWMQQYSAITPKIIRTYPHTRWLKRFIGEGGMRILTPLALRTIIRYKTLPFARTAREYGLKPMRYLWDLLVGDLNLLLDTDAWSPTRALPPNFHRVGPILWEPELPLPSWVEGLDAIRPVIYVNFGSSTPRDLFQQLFAKFANTSYQVIVTTGGQIDPHDVRLPANFYLEKFLPVGAIMERSDLVIYQGGAGTAYQVMRAGVPSLVIATHLDQEYQGLATEQHKAGRFFTLQEVLANSDLLLEATEEIFKMLPVYREHVRHLQADLARYNGPVAAADRIEAFIASGMKRQD